MPESIASMLRPDMASHTAALMMCVMLTATGQLLFKRGATVSRSLGASLINTYTVTGYVLFGIVTVLMVYVMQTIDFKTVTAWTGLTYLLVTGGAGLFLGEHITRSRWVGSLIIVTGIAVFHL